MRIHIWRVVLVGALVAGSALVQADGRGATCFLTGEKVDGGNKICYYDCPSGGAAITVQSHRLCPLRIER